VPSMRTASCNGCTVTPPACGPSRRRSTLRLCRARRLSPRLLLRCEPPRARRSSTRRVFPCRGGSSRPTGHSRRGGRAAGMLERASRGEPRPRRASPTPTESSRRSRARATRSDRSGRHTFRTDRQYTYMKYLHACLLGSRIHAGLGGGQDLSFAGVDS
jgi:hypothetical protein